MRERERAGCRRNSEARAGRRGLRAAQTLAQVGLKLADPGRCATMFHTVARGWRGWLAGGGGGGGWGESGMWIADQ